MMIFDIGKAKEIYFKFKDENEEEKVVPVRGVYVANTLQNGSVTPIPLYQRDNNNG